MNDRNKQIDLINRTPRSRKTVRQHISDFIENSGTVKLSQITTKYQRFPRESRTGVLRQLIDDGLIRVELISGATGAPATVITWIG